MWAKLLHDSAQSNELCNTEIRIRLGHYENQVEIET
jgi:hypothetical protein